MLLPLLLACFQAPVSGREAPAKAAQPSAREVDFSRDVAPLLQRKCVSCHGPSKQANGLRLDNRQDAIRGGHSGPAIVPGNSAASGLMQRVLGTANNRPVMPLKGERLGAEQIALLRSWIDSGAAWTDEPVPAAASHSPDREQGRHWSFEPPHRPSVPQVRNSSWVKNPVDAFVLERLERERMQPSPEAAPATLIRRLSLDLTGLPPSPKELAEFLADRRPDAYERLVDRLLASPQYGEKWALHWLDLARYADSDGYEADRIRPHAWRYRHWVINALNQDLPFDHFTLEQVAGDLLPGATSEQKVSTGFHRNTLKNREGGTSLEQFRFEETVDRTNTVGSVWLGLTVACAQCHDHKYDPISQKEYYQLFAVLNNIEELTQDAPLAGELGPYLAAAPGYRRKRTELLARYRVPELMPPWEADMRLAAANPGQRTDWDHAYDAFQKYLDRADKILRKDPTQRTEREQDSLVDHFVGNYHRVISQERNNELKFKELRKALEELQAGLPDVTRAYVVAEEAERRRTYLHLRGDWRRTGIEVQPSTPAFLPPMREALAPRLALAQWLVSPDNPLTARVTVNRLWQEYFGAGLVRTSEDFGTRGEQPSHPGLLDWLASEFVENAWSLKQMHRLIVTSATYRQSSKPRPELASRDPNNVLLARQTRLRMPAELIRDAALAVSGLLYPEIGGQSVHLPVPTNKKEEKPPLHEEGSSKARYRRGLYVLIKRTSLHPQLVNFNLPNRNVSVCRRERSNTPLQALNLLNDPAFGEASRALALRILAERQGSSEERLDYGFRLCMARPPSSQEAAVLRDYLRRQTEIVTQDGQSAQHLLPSALMDGNSPELAAWVGLSSVLLNLDEFITRE
ncbi:MAG: DUF1553 domain-containing protein [Acidimicrobiia bacterium]|nr:DUF1553 domain-containing protein [Acidimicrobiia bacterium]